MNSTESLEQLKYESDSLSSSLKMANSLKNVPNSELKHGYSLIMTANRILNKDIKVSDSFIDKLTEDMYHYSDSLEPLYSLPESNAVKISSIRGKTKKIKSKRKVIKKKKGCGCK